MQQELFEIGSALSRIAGVMEAQQDTKEENLNSHKQTWYKKGQNSVKRKNQSGCCCIIDDDDKVVSVCGAHEEWAKTQAKDKVCPKCTEGEIKYYSKGLISGTGVCPVCGGFGKLNK